MGLFDIFKRRNNAEINTQDKSEKSDKVEFKKLDKVKRDQYVLDKCELILENHKQMDEAKLEYESVTSYLVDIQEIEAIPKEQREAINGIAEKIDELMVQRKEYHDISEKLTNNQFNRIRMHENEFPKAIDRLKANESYQSTIKRDIHHLEGEKGMLNYQSTSLEDEQEKLKKGAVTVPVILVILSMVIYFIQPYIIINLQIVYFVLIFLAALSGVYIFLKMQDNTNEIKRINNNLNYAIVLLNRTKIKYVNETNAVEYAYEKYGVNSAYELNYLWTEYVKAKEERERLLRSTDDLDYYINRLIHELCKFNVKDADVWVNQTKALLDDREMVEVRHNLNVRRQKLRNRIEFCSIEMTRIKNEVINLAKTNPEYAEEVLEIVSSIDSLGGI